MPGLNASAPVFYGQGAPREGPRFSEFIADFTSNAANADGTGNGPPPMTIQGSISLGDSGMSCIQGISIDNSLGGNSACLVKIQDTGQLISVPTCAYSEGKCLTGARNLYFSVTAADIIPISIKFWNIPLAERVDRIFLNNAASSALNIPTYTRPFTQGLVCVNGVPKLVLAPNRSRIGFTIVTSPSLLAGGSLSLAWGWYDGTATAPLPEAGFKTLTGPLADFTWFQSSGFPQAPNCGIWATQSNDATSRTHVFQAYRVNMGA